MNITRREFMNICAFSAAYLMTTSCSEIDIDEYEEYEEESSSEETQEV